MPSLIVAAQLMPGETMENVADWAAELVKAGLWGLNAEDGGWSITNYIEYEPSRERVLADREATCKRQETRRQNRKTRNAVTNDDVTRDDPVSNAATNASRNAANHPVGNAAPTRPDPTR